MGPSTIETKKIYSGSSCDVTVNHGPTNFGFINCRSIRNKGPLLHDLTQCSDLDILGLVETRPADPDGLLNSLTPINYNLIQKPRCIGLGGGVGFLAENPFLLVLSLHWCLDHLKSSYYLADPSTIALLLLVCIVLLVLALLSFWKIFWLFVAFCLHVVPIS